MLNSQSVSEYEAFSMIKYAARVDERIGLESGGINKKLFVNMHLDSIEPFLCSVLREKEPAQRGLSPRR
jgi:hypothetical protein